ncbi:ArgS-related anticodon-binding protein NrtL [Streptomyces sp. ME19-01-6]|uniref:ArgS-related anticodon-binding protein NrtL n=1 Tax=Streptomyces sp. ME19-01-6 TaxID=3028686 RepID=UPI0029BCC4B4|nr:DALR anticodon-binding domain-containing protein [Streptomyces sp. ME19-01-6]MDX3225492.1 DALR anticodon-binding domain-containing protein [Streptomyces sp. ME19-01-6]
MTPAQLSRTVLQTVRRAVEADELRVAVVPERVKVQTPRRAGCGDYATNVALQLAGSIDGAEGGGPAAALRVAEVLRRRLVRTAGIAAVEIAGPGFLNITVEPGGHAELVRGVLERGEAYGRSDALAGTPAVRLAPGRDVRGAVVRAVVLRLVDVCGGEAEVADGGEVLGVRGVGLGAEELLSRLGSDAAHWALLRAAAHDLPDLDPGRLLAQRESNALFRVRYAHARVRGLLRNGRELGVHSDPDSAYDHPTAAALVSLLGDYPRLLESAARHRAPDRLARHLEATADAFFRFHDACPPLPRGEQKPSAAHRSRLALAEAAGTVLAGGLHLLGISAPEHL